MKEQFRIKAKAQIIAAVKQRMFLLSINKSKNFVTYDQCLHIQNQLQTLQSNNQLAQFVTKNADLLLNIIPASNEKATKQFRKLIAQAQSIIYNQNQIINLKS